MWCTDLHFRVMEKTPNCCTLPSLVALVILLLFPVRSWCKEDTYKSLTEVRLPTFVWYHCSRFSKHFYSRKLKSFSGRPTNDALLCCVSGQARVLCSWRCRAEEIWRHRLWQLCESNGKEKCCSTKQWVPLCTKHLVLQYFHRHWNSSNP